ncbi:hypothetical protein [Streptomyces rhizosphaericus]|uniref:Uncharacterized protein n=1 Tax=Streptomyces rhizosphaericus TaxID=114699 RepID=A0A6G4AVK7_9ACTN|nr:hypothetical protein [Streptomyces rhizosphaericus]NEW77405.1 hypothetical protein [Streptomyces rhizosphaericus]
MLSRARVTSVGVVDIQPDALAARRCTVHPPLQFMDEVSNEPHWGRVARPRPGRRYRFRPGHWCVGELEHEHRGRDFVALRARGRCS